MKKYTLHFFYLVVILLYACSEPRVEEANYETIPLPLEVTKVDGKPFFLTSKTPIIYPEGNELMEQNAQFLKEYLKPILYYYLTHCR